MDITNIFILPEDLVLSQGRELSEEMQKQVECAEGDYVVTRPGARTPSRIVDMHAAALLRMFKSPLTIVDAVINFSLEHQLDPEAMLVEAYPMLQGLIQERFLVPVDSVDVDKISPSFAPGQEVMNSEIIRVVQVLEDVELYQVRMDNREVAAFKIIRQGSDLSSRQRLEREATVLRHLDGYIGPALINTGSYNGRPYLLMEWCFGVDASIAAEELRREGDTVNLLSLCVRILDTYTLLHAKEVVHGDVHPHNILVSGKGIAKIVDYGFAQLQHGKKEIQWQETGGVCFFLEPEYAQALRKGQAPPMPTFVGEQYALAALLYFLLTGVHYLNFSLEREKMLRQIANEIPLGFAEQGVASWPEIEEVLQRALRKNPAERFASLDEFSDQLRKATCATQVISDNVMEKNISAKKATTHHLHGILKDFDPSKALFAIGVPRAPTCSVQLGAAGIAYAFYRMASIREDAKLLSDADLWITRALSDSASSEAFSNAEIDITTESVGIVSPYHSVSGLHAVQALIRHAMGDLITQQGAVESFVITSGEYCDKIDLTLGHSGTLLISALLLDTMDHNALLNRESLLAHGNNAMNHVKHELVAWTPLEERSLNQYLGVAHGWAGCLYAILRWCQSSGSPLPDIVTERLQQLAQYAEPIGRGARWKWNTTDSGQVQYMPGWCHGSAGYVFLWTQAYDILRDEIFLDLGELAAWNAWEEPKGNIPDLCCGLAGRAYSLLNIYKYTGKQEWLRRANYFAEAATDLGSLSRYPRESLYKGTLGVALLMIDLECPETSAMPFFEKECPVGS